MKLEGCDWALLTQSGMSAIDTALSVFQHGKETQAMVVFHGDLWRNNFLYRISTEIAGEDLIFSISHLIRGNMTLVRFEKVISDLKPEFVYIETISNPMLIVADVAGIIDIAKKHGTKVIIDNTFATPWLFKPLNLGADIVIHSATKYFSGHGNLSAGVICGNDTAIMKSAIEYRKFVGHMLSPDDAYRLQTQIQSFELRFSRQCDNASRLAEYLNSSPLIKKVWFPGLKSHTTHVIAEKLFKGKGYGAMITFDFNGKDKEEKRSRRDKFIRSCFGKNQADSDPGRLRIQF